MCGIIGMVSKSRQVASILYFGLYALQHRGKESAGIVTSNGRECYSQRGMGEIPQVFTKDILGRLSGKIGIAHNRYSTSAESNPKNIQPIQGFWAGEQFWLGHNGNLINGEELREYCLSRGCQPPADSDTGVIAALISLTDAFSFEEAVKKTLPLLQGAFSIVILYKDRIIGLRDNLGIRPLHLGRTKEGDFVLASETCALHHMGAALIKEIDPGEILVISKSGARRYYHPPVTKRKFCIYEFIYFSRPDSVVFGRRVGDAQENMGRLLAQEHPVEADMAIPIPDSANYGGWGFIEVSKIPGGQKAILRTHLISRTFIEAIQELREKGVDLKFVIFIEKVRGLIIVLIDDSIVRGTTMKRLVKLFREAGVKGVHARIFSPPYMYPCYLGIDTYRVKDELAARRNGGDVEKIRKELSLDSLEYLNLESVIRAVIETPCVKEPCIPLTEDDFCTACFSGDYPIKPPKNLL